MDDRLFNDATLLDDDIQSLLFSINKLLYEIENELPTINGEQVTIDICRLEDIHEALHKVYYKISEVKK
jgi:hypothetical protein